jgi:hypothetical protein
MRYIYPILITVTLGPLAVAGLISAAQRHYWSPTGSGALLALVAAYGAHRLKARPLALLLLVAALFGLASLDPTF